MPSLPRSGMDSKMARKGFASVPKLFGLFADFSSQGHDMEATNPNSINHQISFNS